MFKKILVLIMVCIISLTVFGCNEKYTQKDIKEINKRIIETPLSSLDGHTTKEAFIKVYDE